MKPAKDTTIRRAAGYVRISALMGREHGVDLLSDEIQKEKIEAWAAYRDYRIVEWYADIDVSGTGKVRRPQFERMMEDARDHRFEAVAVYKLTRFARSVRAAAVALEELDKLDVGLVSVTEDIDTTTAGGRFMRNVLFSVAEFESERIGEEWKNVHESRRRRGIAHVARPVTGYRQTRDEGGRIITATLDAIEPVEAQAIRKMYAMRDHGAGYGAIRQALMVEGYTTRLGHSRFPQSTISGILRNPIYAGLVRTSEGDLVDAVHDAIVPRDLWERVQARHSHVARTNQFRASLLSGLVVCSSCGYRMHFEEYRRKRANGYVQPAAYRCAGRQRADGCGHPMFVHAEYADEHIEAEFREHFRNPGRMPHGGKLKATRQQREWGRRLGLFRGRLDELDRALDEIAGQRFVKGSLGATEYDRQAGRFLQEREDVQRQHDDLDRMVKTVRPLERNVLDLWDQLTVDVKRQALRIAIAEIRVLPSPRRGRGQRQLVPQRLDIAWTQ